MRTVSKGDRVRVLHRSLNGEYLNGDTGTVKSVDDSDHRVQVSVLLDKNDRLVTLHWNDLDVIASFKVGDGSCWWFLFPC